MRIVFIGGADRSGTTMLASQLGHAISGIVIPESQFLRDLIPVQGDTLTARIVGEVLRESWRFSVWRTDVGAVLKHLPESGSVTLSQVVRALAMAYGGLDEDSSRKIAVIDHTPDVHRISTVLRGHLPKARFVHIVRDGRAVYASVKGLDWGPTSASVAAEWWMAKVAEGLASEWALGPGAVARVRYEDLCQDCEETLDHLLLTLELDGPDASERGDFDVPEYTSSQHRLVGMPPQADRVGRWRSVLSVRDTTDFERVAGGLLAALGYDVPQATILRPASAYRRAIARIVDAGFLLGWKLPRRLLRISRAKRRDPSK